MSDAYTTTTAGPPRRAILRATGRTMIVVEYHDDNSPLIAIPVRTEGTKP